MEYTQNMHSCSDCLGSGLTLQHLDSGYELYVPYCRCVAGVKEKSNKKHWHCPICNDDSVSNRKERIDRHVKKHMDFVVADYGLTARAGRGSRGGQHPLMAALTPPAYLPPSPDSVPSAISPSLSPLWCPQDGSMFSPELEPFFNEVENGFLEIGLSPGTQHFDPASMSPGAFAPPTPDAAQIFLELDKLPYDLDDSMIQDLILALAGDSDTQLEHAPTQRMAPGHVIIPLTKGRALAVDAVPRNTDETHFTVDQDQGVVRGKATVIKGLPVPDLVTSMFSISASSGYLICDYDVRVITCSLADREAQLHEFTVRRAVDDDDEDEEDEEEPEKAKTVGSKNDDTQVDPVAGGTPTVAAAAAGEPKQLDALVCEPTDKLRVAVYRPERARGTASIALSVSLVLAKATAPRETFRQTHTQVFYVKDGLPTKVDVANHLHLLLNTVHRVPAADQEAWQRVIDAFESQLSIDALRRTIKELKPRSWSDVSAELIKLAFTLTPEELCRGVHHLLRTELKAELENEVEAAKWAAVLNAILALKRNSTTPVAAFIKGLQTKPEALARLQVHLNPCRDIVAS